MTGNNYSVFAEALADVYIPEALNKLSDSEMEHTFSAQFEKKMNRLVRKERKFYFSFIKTTSRKAATISVTMLVMLSLMCMSAGAFRSTVADLVSRVFVNTSRSERPPAAVRNATLPETTAAAVTDIPETEYKTQAPSSVHTSASRTTTAVMTETVITSAKPVTTSKQTSAQYDNTDNNKEYDPDYYFEKFIKPAEEIRKKAEKKKYWASYPDEFSPYPYEDILTNDNIIAVDTNDEDFCYYLYPEDSKLFIKDDCVEVTLKHQYSQYGKTWTPADFACGNIASVDDLSVKPYNDSIPFRHVLKINIAEHGKDKIAEIIGSLSKCEEVMKIRPYYVECEEYTRYELRRHDAFHVCAENDGCFTETEQN